MELPFAEVGERAGWVDRRVQRNCFFVTLSLTCPLDSQVEVSSQRQYICLQSSGQRPELEIYLRVIRALVILKATAGDE